MEKLRLKIRLAKDQIDLPINYQHILQGLIYSVFPKEGFGQFLHDVGYRYENRVFKLFVFSNLFGDFHREEKRIVFDRFAEFYIGSLSEEFLQMLYDYFSFQDFIFLGKNKVKVESIDIEHLNYFSQTKEVVLQTLSPVVAYRTDGQGKFDYFKPTDPEFEQLCIQNIQEKMAIWNAQPFDLCFQIKEVLFEKKRITHFKNTFYIAYTTKIKVEVNYPTLSMIWNTGLSAKGSAGFGMVRIAR